MAGTIKIIKINVEDYARLKDAYPNPIEIKGKMYSWDKDTVYVNPDTDEKLQDITSQIAITLIESKVFYALSDSETEKPESGWSETAPAYQPNKYMWQKTYKKYTSGTETESYTCISGAKGEAGTSPHVGENGNWWIGTTDTGVKAQGEDGEPGSDGLNQLAITLYQRSTSLPLKPSGNITYHFDTKQLDLYSGCTWKKEIPEGTAPCYVIVATASSSTLSDTILPAEWSEPQILAQNGTDGINGISTAIINLYQRATTPPTQKPTQKLTYDFKTNTLSPATGYSGWYRNITDIPSENNEPCYITAATAISQKTDGTCDIEPGNWADIKLYVKNGDSGTGSFNLDIENDFDSIPCDKDGNPKYTSEEWKSETTHKVKAFCGGTELSFSVKDTVPTAADGITLYYNPQEVTFAGTTRTEKLSSYEAYITGISSDTGCVLYYLYVAGNCVASAKFEASKLKTGQDGQDTIDYKISSSTKTIRKTSSGTITPDFIKMDFYKKIGTNTTAFNGYYTVKVDDKAEETIKQAEYVIIDSTTIAQASNKIKVSLYLDETKTILVESEEVTIIQDARSIGKITSYYQATNDDTTPPPIDESLSGWSTDAKEQPLSENKKYLWNFERIFDVTDGKINDSAPAIIARYTKDGKGISSIIEYYQATSSNEAPAKPTSGQTPEEAGWSTTAPVVSSDVQYLWNYEIINYSDSSKSETNVILMSKSGKDGEDGVSAIRITIDNDFDSIPCLADGTIKPGYDWLKTTHTLKAYWGTAQINFKVSNTTPMIGEKGYIIVPGYTSDIAYVPGTLEEEVSSYTARLSNLNSDVGFVYYSLYYNDDIIATCKFEASKLYAGQAGQDGEDGDDAVDYWITASATEVKKNADGTYTPDSVTFNFYKQVGSGTPTSYSGWYTTKVGSGAESAVSKDTMYSGTPKYWSDSSMTVTLYGNEEKTIKYDSETVTIVANGAKGDKGDPGSPGPKGSDANVTWDNICAQFDTAATTEKGIYYSKDKNAMLLNATAGKIANWTISNNNIGTGTCGADGSMFLSAEGVTAEGSIGGSDIGKTNWTMTSGTNFGVDKTGALYANSGKIAGFTMSSSGLNYTAGNQTFKLSTTIGTYIEGIKFNYGTLRSSSLNDYQLTFDRDWTNTTTADTYGVSISLSVNDGLKINTKVGATKVHIPDSGWISIPNSVWKDSYSSQRMTYAAVPGVVDLSPNGKASQIYIAMGKYSIVAKNSISLTTTDTKTKSLSQFSKVYGAIATGSSGNYSMNVSVTENAATTPYTYTVTITNKTSDDVTAYVIVWGS